MSKKKQTGGRLIPNDPVLAAMAQQLTQVHVDLREKETEAELLAGVAEDLEMAMANWQSMQTRLVPKMRPTPTTRALVNPTASPTRPTSKEKPPATKASPKTSSAEAPGPRLHKTADADVMAYLDGIYSGDTLIERTPRLRGVYEALDGSRWACVGTAGGGDVPIGQAYLFGVVPSKGWKEPLAKNANQGYRGLKVTCRGKQYVMSGPDLTVSQSAIKADWKQAPKPTKAAAPKASAKPAAKPKEKHQQTWNQWASSLRPEFDLPVTPSEFKLTAMEQFFWQAFEEGRRPGEARKAWLAAASKSAENARAGDVFDVEAFDNVVLEHEDFSALAKASLRMAATGILPSAINLPGVGIVAVIGMGDDEAPGRDRFYCQELLDPDDSAETFELRAAQTAKGKPMELAGVGVTLRNPPGDKMFGPRRVTLVMARPGTEKGA